MDLDATRLLYHGTQIDRRRVLRTGGALAGAAALLRAPCTVRAAPVETFIVDMAEDVRTFRLNPGNPAKSNGVPVVGDTFIEWGSLYPAGTIDKGLKGPDQAGAIGRWICRGTFVADVASGATPAVITTVLMAFGEGLSATAGKLDPAPDALLTEGLEGGVDKIVRTVAGGYGMYAGARGQVLQVARGENDIVMEVAGMKVPGSNYTFTFTFAG